MQWRCMWSPTDIIALPSCAHVPTHLQPSPTEGAFPKPTLEVSYRPQHPRQKEIEINWMKLVIGYISWLDLCVVNWCLFSFAACVFCAAHGFNILQPWHAIPSPWGALPQPISISIAATQSVFSRETQSVHLLQSPLSAPGMFSVI